jgi:hypothetical protein
VPTLVAVAHAATGDCERIRPGPIGQPVNTASSGAYLVAAAWVWRRRATRRPLWVAVLAAVRLGSIAYHGPGTRAGKALHDGAVVALGVGVATAVIRPNPRLPVAAAIGAASAVLHAGTRTGCRACRPDSPFQGHAAWHVLSASAVALLADGERR